MAKSKTSNAGALAAKMMGATSASSTTKPAKSAPAKAAPAKAAPAKAAKGGALARAIGAAKEGDFADALAAALEVWAAAPSIAIAEAIERLGARAAASTQPPAGTTPKARAAAWDAAARAGDPVARHHLLAQLTETKGNAETLARLQLLEPYDDPRITDAILRLIESPIYNASVSRTNTFWKYVFARLPLLRDPRIAPRTASWVAGWAANGSLNEPERVVLAKRLSKLALPAIADAAHDTTALLATLDADASARAGDTSREAELLAAVYAAPADDGPRLVYADWLEQRGDPRGEFINLQLAGKPSAREAELLAMHGQRWLGALAPYVYKGTIRYARGFLATARVHNGDDEDLSRRPPADPAWATLEEIRSVLPPLADVALPVLRSLAELRYDDLVYLATVPAKRFPPLAHLELVGAYNDWRRRWDADATAAAAAFNKLVLPALRHLEIRGSDAWTDEPGMSPRAMIFEWRRPGLATFAVASTFSQLATWRTAVDAYASITHFELRTGADTHWDATWTATLTRDAGGALSILAVTCPTDVGGNAVVQVDALVRGFTALAANSLSRITLQLPPKQLFVDSFTALEAALAELGATTTITHRKK